MLFTLLFKFVLLVTMHKYAHIIQQNLNRQITTSPDLYFHIQQKLQSTPGVIAALQEPRVHDGFITTFPDKHLIYCRNSPTKVPRAALYVSNGLHVSPLASYSEADMASAL